MSIQVKDPLTIHPEYGDALNALGFCILPLLNNAQLSAIASVYEKYYLGNEVFGLIATHNKMKSDQSIAVSRLLADITAPSLDLFFKDYEYFVGGFMVKEANTQSELSLHNDWNLVDESRYNSYHIWIPLEMSDTQNGGMIVLPGSHIYFDNFRSGSYGIPAVPRNEKLKQYTTDVHLAPGMGLVFHDALFHASHPNNSNRNRIAAVISIRDKHATNLYYHKNKTENRTDIYTIDSNTFLNNLNTLGNGLPPDQYQSVEHTALSNFDTSKINADDLCENFEKNNFTNSQGHDRDDQIIISTTAC